MSVLDKKYKVAKLDINKKIYNSDLDIMFSISDNETSDFYLRITKETIDIDLSSFSVVLCIKKPDQTIILKTIQQDEDGLFYCNLENKYKDKIGIYKVQAYIENENTFERVATLGSFTYEVLDDILHQRKDSEEPSGEKIEITYNEENKTLVFGCDANYNSETNTVEVD